MRSITRFLLFLLPAASLAQQLSTSESPSVSFLPNRQPTTINVPVVVTLSAAPSSGTGSSSHATVTSGGSAVGNSTAAATTAAAAATTTTSATSTLPAAPATTVVAGTYTAPSPGATINGQVIGPGDNYVAAGRRAMEVGGMLAVTVAAVGLGLQYLL